MLEEARVLEDARLAARFLRDLPHFLRNPVGPEEGRRRVRHQLESRDRTFLALLERAVHSNPRSPYGPLMRHQGIEPGDVDSLVRARGADGAAAALYDAGVRLSLKEFKCVRPIVRPGLELHPRASDFDNPLLRGHLAARSGGSTGARRRIVIDFEALGYNAGYEHLMLSVLRAEDRAAALWYPVPPGVAGVAWFLRRQKIGKPVACWFTQTKPRLRDALGPAFLTVVTVAGAKIWGPGGSIPRHVPPERADVPARWLADGTASGAPRLLACTPSSAVRVCQTAGELGLDISGSVFRLGGEPYTPGKADVIERTGARAGSNYYSTEVSQGGICCGDPAAVDDVHITEDGLAVLQRDLDNAAGQIGALFFTTLRPNAAKMLINVESGDYGVIEERDCECPVGAIGLRRHLHTIRSYDKLVTAGMNFLGSDLHALVEEVLPARFGGYPTDYQFVEVEDEGGLTRIDVLVSPRVGHVEEADVVAVILDRLGSPGAPQQMMSDVWRLGRTLRLLRRDPYVTEASKTPPVRALGPR